MEVLYGVLGVVVLGAVLCGCFIVRRGNAEFKVKTEERTKFAIERITDTDVVLRTAVEIANEGKQCGTIMDCYTRHLLPYEQFDGVAVSSRVELQSAPREDDYFEALLIQKGCSEKIWVEVRLESRRGGNIKDVLTEMVDLPIEVVYQYVARNPWKIAKKRIVLTADELAAAVGIELADK